MGSSSGFCWGLRLWLARGSDSALRQPMTPVCYSVNLCNHPATNLFFQFVQSVSVLDSTRLDWCFHSTAIVATFVILQDRFTASCKAICCTRNCNTLTVFLLSLTCKKGYITDNDYWSTVYWFYWSTDILPTDFTDLLKLIYWRPLSHIVITATVWIGQVRGN